MKGDRTRVFGVTTTHQLRLNGSPPLRLSRAGVMSAGLVAELAPTAPNSRGGVLLAYPNRIAELAQDTASRSDSRQDARQGAGRRGERGRGRTRAPASTPESDLARVDDGLPARLDGPRLWPTPRGSNGGSEMKKSNTPGHTGVNLATAVRRLTPGTLSPRWVEWLMGFPPEWTAV